VLAPQHVLGKLAERLSTRSVRLARMIPEIAVQALRDLVLKQAAARAKAGTAWKENNLVFCTRTTEVVYRHQLRPVTRTAAIALGPLFESKGKTNGGQT